MARKSLERHLGWGVVIFVFAGRWLCRRGSGGWFLRSVREVVRREL